MSTPTMSQASNTSGRQDYLLARRTSSPSEITDYLVVHETNSGSNLIQSIQQITFEAGTTGATGIAITLPNNVVDYIIATLDKQPPYQEHRVSGFSNFIVQGEFAHVRVRNGNVEWMKLHQGKKLQFGNKVLASTRGDYSLRGTVTNTLRIEKGSSKNGFTVAGVLANDGSLLVKTLVVT